MKIYRTIAVFAICFFLATSNFLTGLSPLEAMPLDSDVNQNNTSGLSIEESNDDSVDSKMSVVPDLGDDQAFPFIPGFGKNSGKDWEIFCDKGLTKKLESTISNY